MSMEVQDEYLYWWSRWMGEDGCWENGVVCLGAVVPFELEEP